MMIFTFVGAIIGYFGVIRLQRQWYKRGVLTETSFVLLQVSVLSLLILTGFLAFSTTLKATIMASALTLIFMIFGILLGRRIYRKHFTIE